MRGRFSRVSTASTPATRNASLASMRLMRPLAMLEVTTAACARSCVLYSAAYFAAPVTFARPSMRDVGVPIYVIAPLVYRSDDALRASRAGSPQLGSVNQDRKSTRLNSSHLG